jgi:hypothetical protein
MATWAQKIFKNNVYGKKAQMRNDIQEQTGAIDQSISQIPTYQISPEVQQMLAMYEQSAKSLEQQKGALNNVNKLAQEATGISKNLASMSEAPGSAIARDDIRQSTASSVQNIKEAAGGNIGALSAISQSGLNEQMALRDLAKTNLQFRTQAEQDLMNSLRSEAGIAANVAGQQAGITGQQAGMRAAGLGAMTGERQNVYESELNKYLTGLQFDTQQLSNQQMELENLKNRRAQLWSSGLSALGSIGGAALGGPVGAGIGSKIGNTIGGAIGGSNQNQNIGSYPSYTYYPPQSNGLIPQNN